MSATQEDRLDHPQPPKNPASPASQDIPHEQSLIEYPCHFPIKVMGINGPDFLPTMLALVRCCDPALDASQVEQRPSKGGNYMGLTFTVWVTNRPQLDALYTSLSGHPLVKMVL